MLKKAIFAVLVLLSFVTPISHADQATNPFFKPSERNPVVESVDVGPMCDPEEREAYEGRISSLQEENSLLTLSVEEYATRIAALEDELQKAKKIEAQKFMGIVNDKAIFFDDINKVYIYKNKNEIDGELLK